MPSPSRQILIAAGTLVATAGTAGSARAQGGRHVLRGEAAVYDLAGTIRVVPGTGRDIVVDVTPQGRDAQKLRVETGEVRGRQAVRVVFPDDDVVYPAMGGDSRVRTRVRSDGTFGDTDTHGFFSSHDVTIRASGRGTQAWADMTIAVPPGQRLAVHLGVGDATVSNVDGDLMFDVAAATVTAERTRGRLMVDAGSGRVRIAGAQGDIDLDLGSGPVELQDVAADRLKVDGGSGSITGSNVAAPSIDLDVGSGRTRLDRVSTRTLKVDAGSGSVDVGLTTDVDDVRIDTGSGDVTLRIPPSLGAEIDVDTGSGGIETEVPIQITRKERDHLTGRIGDGKGHIVIDGGSGGVRIRKS
jgi:DUF4097 and DUF4098 domain-containing protein YvlB